MEFEREGFRSLGQLLSPLYFRSAGEKGESFLQGSFGKPPDPRALQDLERGFLPLRDKPLFRLDDSVWTIGDFQMEFERHPLVFRKKKFSPREYPGQLKAAIADQVRDHYLTRVAYARGYDSHPAVRRYVGMWKDADAALYQKQVVLRRSSGGQADALDLMTGHIDSLQGMYGHRVEINTEAFNAVKLTRVSAFAMERDVPFPVYVPSFPVITTDHNLEYGRALEGAGKHETG
jgi:hypothetical protein